MNATQPLAGEEVQLWCIPPQHFKLVAAVCILLTPLHMPSLSLRAIVASMRFLHSVINNGFSHFFQTRQGSEIVGMCIPDASTVSPMQSNCIAHIHTYGFLHQSWYYIRKTVAFGALCGPFIVDFCYNVDIMAK